MTKNEKYDISIGELSRSIDLPTHTIRYWHQMFHHIDHQTSDGGRRYYNSNSILQFEEIKDLLHVKKFTINGAQDYLYSKKNNITSKKNITNPEKDNVSLLNEKESNNTLNNKENIFTFDTFNEKIHPVEEKKEDSSEIKKLKNEIKALKDSFQNIIDILEL